MIVDREPAAGEIPFGEGSLFGFGEWQ